MIEETYSFVDSLTGRRKLTVRPAAGGWRSKVNAVDGARTHALLVRERGHLLINRDMWAELLQPWRTRFVVEWNGVVKYAGWVLGHDWDSAIGRLEVKHADFRAIAARRALFGIGPVNLPDIVIDGRSLRGLMGEFAWYALCNGGYRWALRLVIDDADRFETGPFTETIQRHRLDTLESLLRDVQTRDGGPEVHFFPRWSPTDGALEDVLRIGTPTLTSNVIEVNGTAPKTPLTGFGYILDAEEQRTGVWGVAQGRGDDGIIGLARDVPGSEIPILDASHDIKATTDQAVADSQAMGILRQNREPIKQYRFQLADPDLAAQAEIGTRVRVYHPGDELQPRGWIEGRVIALSHNVGSRSPQLEVQ